MTHRENLEWTQTWWEQSEKDDLPRVLLIGDSIVVGYRDAVQKNLQGKAYVDKFATSKFAKDPFFKKELELYLNEYKYDCIHFNHGLHGRDFSINDYTESYEEILKMLTKVCDNVVLVLSTPITKENDVKTLDVLNENVVKPRNEAVKDIAKKYNLAVDDLYTPMIDHYEYRVDDGYHYNEKGRTVQGKIVAEFIENTLKTK